MTVGNLLKDLNITKKDFPYLLILIIFASLITAKVIAHNMTIHIRSDGIIYLINALFYAGLNENIQNTWTMFLSPVICFLTGMLLKLGLGRESIFIVTGIFDLLAYISMYILLKYRFNKLLSMFGSVLFGSFSLVLTNWADGTIDVPVVTVSIWVIIFLILAVHENPKYYLITLPLLTIAIFTKYSAFFMVPLVLLYYLSINDFFNVVDSFFNDRSLFKKKAKEYLQSDEFKCIALGVIIAVVLFALFCLLITSYGGGLLFTTQISDSMGGFNQGHYVKDKFYNDTGNFYVSNLTNIFYFTTLDIFNVNLSSIILALLVVSAAIHIITCLINIEFLRELLRSKKGFLNRNFDKFLKILIIIFAAIFIYGYVFNHILANIALLTIMVIILSFLDKLDISKKFYSMNFLMLAWFLVYLIFYSKINIKMGRYLISTLPAVVYFILWAVEAIFATVQNGFNYGESFKKYLVINPNFKFSDTSKGTILKIILIISIALLMVYSFSYETEETFTIHTNDELDELCNYLMVHDPDYGSKTIASYNSYCSRYCEWCLHKDVILNKTLDRVPTEDYIISMHPEKYPNYRLVYKTDTVYLYGKV
ncbi:glycosyltransferase family 39 protein [Methanobrevibacter sp.]|uniref:glycosyltransferase family 39 protein n=1 Tax=Methanobrevibacter sp. TaxID=66852 RepID=UPI0038911915